MTRGATAEPEEELSAEMDGALAAPLALEPTVPVMPRLADAAVARSALLTLVLLALPILAENILHMMVGLTDTWLAGHLSQNAEAATAAIGTIAYILWFVNLIAMAVATGATAIVSRAVGAKHRSLANSVAGQSVGASLVIGTIAAAAFYLFSAPLADLTQLHGLAREYALFYFKILSLSLPFSMLTVAAGAVLRGSGNTLTPAVALVVVDAVNMGLSASLTHGYFGLPELGFKGIAIGTVVAYVIGGIILFVALMRGKRVRLHLHRLRPHWRTLRRLLRIGLPNGVEGGLTWSANFVILASINRADPSNLSAAAHIIAIRLESLSFMLGLAIATATATLVGQSLGRRQPEQAQAYTVLSFKVGLIVMASWALAFIFAGKHLAAAMSNDLATVDLAARCLFVTAFSQPGFAATLIFGGALRGAGDTLSVMIINIVSQLSIRLVAVLTVIHVFHFPLPAVWVVLASELTIRGTAMALRFAHGGWKDVVV